MQARNAFKALANPRRLQILEWLKNPRAHFEPQVDGDLVKDGVCAILIAEKLGITQATLSEHMRVLVETGMVNPKRIKQWIFYRRNEQAIARFKSEILDKI
jgi:ArsR family transcriptional regulator